MNNNDGFDDEPIADLPISPALRVLGLGAESEDDLDKIEWSEVTRLVYERDWGPILALPTPERSRSLPRQLDEEGNDISPFNTHDFTRMHGGFDRHLYAIDKARLEHRNHLIMFQMYMERINDARVYRTLRLVRLGYIRTEQLEGDVERAAFWFRKILAARAKICRIAAARRRAGR